MKWTVKFHDEFKAEFDELDQEVKDELLAEAKFVGSSARRRAALTSIPYKAHATQT